MNPLRCPFLAFGFSVSVVPYQKKNSFVKESAVVLLKMIIILSELRIAPETIDLRDSRKSAI